MIANIGILSASDRASEGKYEDISGQVIQNTLKSYLKSEWQHIYKLVADEQIQIQNALIELCDKHKCSLVVTTGGTGPAPRDITPEATINVCNKILPGFGELMRQESLKYVPTAILSRQTAGIRGNSLIVNLPGKPKSIKECLDVIFPAIPYCIDLIGGAYLQTNEDIIKAFRPKHK